MATPPAPASGGTDKILTPANIVTMVRICLVPVFVIALISPWPEWLGVPDLIDWKCWIAAGIFVLISCTDWLDGYLARSRNEVTDFGKFMDPMADKILVMAALLALIELGALPSWVVLVILAREFIVSGVRMVAASKGEVIAASWYGKAKTFTQIIAIVLFIIKESTAIPDFSSELYTVLYVVSWIAMTVALVLTIVSMMDYIAKARHLIGFPKKDKAGNAASQTASAGAEPAKADAADVIAAARHAGLKIATAESCTGGLIAAELTSVAGASDVFAGSVVSYSNDVKMQRLGVEPEALAAHGAVSEPVACQMALGALDALGVDAAVAVTGIAGPGGAVPGKPVGSVWIAVAANGAATASLHHFDGSRDQVRKATADAALQMLYGAICKRSMPDAAAGPDSIRFH